MTLIQWAALIGMVSTLLTIIGIFFKLHKLSYQVGKTEQAFNDKLDNLNTSRTEHKDDIKRALNVVDEHVKNIAIHVNPTMSERLYDEQKEWRRDVQQKIDKIYEMQLRGKKDE